MRRFSLLFILLPLAFPAFGSCPWPDPGANRYTGLPGPAIVALQYPAHIAGPLIKAAEDRAYYQMATVTRDRMTLDDGTELTGLQNMNFGDGRVCRGPVDRSMWPDGRILRALVYRERGHYLLSFTSCGNFARAFSPRDTPANYAALPAGPGLRPVPWWQFWKDKREVQPVQGAVQPAPEPGTLGLVIVALVVLLWIRRHAAR